MYTYLFVLMERALGHSLNLVVVHLYKYV